MDSFRSINAFVHAAELSSYAAAARVLGISPSAIAKSVARLEDDLGVRLFHRTTRSIGLTEEGNVFYERCKFILGEIRDTKALIAETRAFPKGKLHVSVPQIFGHTLLMPLLPKFLGKYPDVQLDIDFEDRVVDLIAEGVDIAVRSGELADNRLVGRKLGEQYFVVCASKKYIESNGTPSTPTELMNHHCIHFKYPTSGRIASWSFIKPYEDLDLPRDLIFNNTHAGLRAAIEGLGIAHLPVYVAEEAFKKKSLIPLLTQFMSPLGSMSLIWPSNRHLSPKVRAFSDFISNELSSGKYLSNNIDIYK
ncbi:LysR family transcriptional regulator [Pectobacteriaceae bacterium CE90]|nr:LysR family transcriptional regulator [Prodigiosinella sp. LS101]WJV55315.1 LysR family transcriptional regulator [Prodigiosinella sp. LS101]WJV59678.1 LysR family transcriptional regulator [Pectobacteriaceae bacterium C111]WJY13790.1 LysR family transcriptional regulator [Pectobacteriaceae bacterium CE90]